MDTNNWRPNPPTGDSTMDADDWRSQLLPDTRQRNVDNLMETMRHLPEGVSELQKIAVRFEEEIFTAANSQSDYLRRIFLKMLTMESKSQNTTPYSGDNSKAPDLGRIGRANGGDWQEELYQKIKVLREAYLSELTEMFLKVSIKLQQHESLTQLPESDQLYKLNLFKITLQRIINFLNVSKANILPNFKERVIAYEKQILSVVNTNKPRKHASKLQPGQLPHMHSMLQPQQQINQTQSHDTQLNLQLQSASLQGSVAAMQPNNMTTQQHISLSLPGVSTALQTMLNSLQPCSDLDSGQGNALGSMQQVASGALQQNSVSNSQPENIKSLSLQSNLNILQQNMNPLQSNSNMFQNQHLRQQQEQQMLQSQQLKQHYQQIQMMQQQQQAKQQLPTQLPIHQMPQLHQMNDVNDGNLRQGINVKPGVFQHLPAGQHQPYTHQQLKPGAQFHSSPQLLQAASLQMPQHSSPQMDPLGLLTSIPKTGTPLQSANSPFVVPSPSTPKAPLPMPGESEKPIPRTSSPSHAANVGYQQGACGQVGSQSLAIGTPGISASPLLAEFTGADGTHTNALTTISSKSNSTEQPLERFLNAVKSMLPRARALRASVIDIGSVVSMTDRIAGSAPGNGSRAAVGEDLVAMTKCRLQARNSVSPSQQVNINGFSLQSSLNVLQQNMNPLQFNYNMFQNQHLKQQQPAQPQQQQQSQPHLLGQQTSAANIQQNQLIGQQKSKGDMQHQRLLSQANNLRNLHQQQLMAQQNNQSNIHQQSLDMLHQAKVQLQQSQQSVPNLLPIQGQTSQQLPQQQQQQQQQLMSQMQSQSTQLQQQLGLQQQPNQLQRDMQQRLQASAQTSSNLLQSQNIIDLQKQLYQSQRAVPETSSRCWAMMKDDFLASLKNILDSLYPNNMTNESFQDVKEHLIPDILHMYSEKDESERMKEKSVRLSRHLTVGMKLLIDEIKYLKDENEELATKNNKLTSEITKIQLGSLNKELEQHLHTEESHNSPSESHGDYQPIGDVPDVEMSDASSDRRVSTDDESASISTESFQLEIGHARIAMTEFLKKLEEADVPTDVKLSDFSNLEGEQKEFGRYNFPLSLIHTVERINKIYGDVSVNVRINRSIAESVYVMFCAVIKEMDDMQLGEITEDKMLKWRDVINDALRLKFNVRFAMEHLRRIGRAYFGLKAILQLKSKNSELENKWENYKTKLELIDCYYATQQFLGVPVSTGLFIMPSPS